MKKRIVSALLLAVMVFGSVVGKAGEELTAYLADYELEFKGENLNDRLSYPLLSYYGEAYMAIRDAAKLINKRAEWEEEIEDGELYRGAWLESARDEADAIGKETALEIGIAFIEEYCSDKIGETTVFFVSRGDSAGAYDDVWLISAIFNIEEEYKDDETYILTNADTVVEINVKNCTVSMYHWTDEGCVYYFRENLL